MGAAPRAKWDNATERFLDNDDPLLVWQGMLDKRYQIEVHRQQDVAYKGTLYIFDMGEILNGVGDQVNVQPPLMFEREVTLQFNAQFGPDISDELAWQDLAVEVIDAL
jgi:hypothetical protein